MLRASKKKTNAHTDFDNVGLLCLWKIKENFLTHRAIGNISITSIDLTSSAGDKRFH